MKVNEALVSVLKLKNSIPNSTINILALFKKKTQKTV